MKNLSSLENKNKLKKQKNSKSPSQSKPKEFIVSDSKANLSYFKKKYSNDV